MVESSSHLSSLCKERNKLIKAVNYLAWKKRIDLILTEQDVMGYVTGEIIEPRKDKTQELERYKKWEVRYQRTIVEPIKDSLVPFVANLKTSKAMYDKLVNLYSVSTRGQKMYVRNKLYRMKKLKDEGMASFLVRFSQSRDHLQGHGEPITDLEMTICVLSAFPPEWNNFTTSI